MTKNIPQHLGIIIDGNRRWARKRGLPTLVGHQKGYDKVKKVCDWCFDRGVKILTFYVFSTENWKRSRREVSYLMKLLKKALTKDIQEIHQRNIKLKVLGRIKGLSPDLQKAIKAAEKLTQNNTRGVMNLAINYGGRPEIIDAIKKIIKQKISPQKVTEELIAKNLYSAEIPDPDLIIRTSGEQRLSNFLIWQAAYSELYFIKKHFPSLTEKDIDKALEDYGKRHRRFGQ